MDAGHFSVALYDVTNGLVSFSSFVDGEVKSPALLTIPSTPPATALFPILRTSGLARGAQNVVRAPVPADAVIFDVAPRRRVNRALAKFSSSPRLRAGLLCTEKRVTTRRDAVAEDARSIPFRARRRCRLRQPARLRASSAGGWRGGWLLPAWPGCRRRLVRPRAC